MEPNAATRIERHLARQVLRGELPPGARLASVRDLAARFGVNQATIQRVIARLESAGLVLARHGSGVEVLDPHEVGLSLLPAWIEAWRDQPAEAARLLADLLELRRIVAAALLSRHRERLLAGDEELTRTALALAAAAGGDVPTIQAADLAFARAVLRRAGNLPALAVLNALGRVLDRVPEVAAAMYAHPEENAASVARVLVLVAEREGPELAAALESEIAQVDARTVTRFQALLVDAEAVCAVTP